MVTALIVAGAAILGFLATVHDFLAVSRPTGQGILMVEGWIPSQCLPNAIRVFRGGSYSYLVVVGSQIEPDQGSANYADRTVGDLTRLGLEKKNIVEIAMPYVSVKRTFAETVAFRQWIASSSTRFCCVDLYTVGTHARKSWISLETVLGDKYRVGVIASPETSYNPHCWFCSRRGRYIVARNFAGYLYTRFEIVVGTAPR